MSMYNTVTVTPTLISNIVEVTATVYNPFYSQDVNYYSGPYEFTPTDSTQTVSIDNLMATQDITINPIPSNYGLITWDGATLTVS